jgi:hypothetical protein
LRSPALILSVNRGCHAVLAAVSRCYSPLGGRSPTRYSPVRRSTWGLPPFRARLACVRHAASVDSEPGSNSPVKLATLRNDLAVGPRRPSILKVLFGPCELNLAGIFSRLPSFQRATPTLGDQTRIPNRGRAVNPFSGLFTTEGTSGSGRTGAARSHGTRCNAPGKSRYYEAFLVLSSDRIEQVKM